MLARVSTFPAPFSRYLAWKSGADKDSTSFEIETLATHMLTPSVLLDLILNYTVFETQEQKDPKT